VRRGAFGAAPRDGRVETQERVDALDWKVGAERETFPWRSPAKTQGVQTVVVVVVVAAAASQQLPSA